MFDTIEHNSIVNYVFIPPSLHNYLNYGTPDSKHFFAAASAGGRIKTPCELPTRKPPKEPRYSLAVRENMLLVPPVLRDVFWTSLLVRVFFASRQANLFKFSGNTRFIRHRDVVI